MHSLIITTSVIDEQVCSAMPAKSAVNAQREHIWMLDD